MASPRIESVAGARMRRALAYAAAVAAVGAATMLKTLYAEWIGQNFPVAMYLAAVMLAAWVGGTGPGLVATALATLAGAYFFSFPYGSFSVASQSDLVRLALGAAEGAFISILVGALHRAEQEAHARADELEARTAALEQATVELRHAQRMDSVGRMAGSVAHDFNNMMAVVLSYADVIAAGIESGRVSSEDVAQLRAAGLRAAALARQLLVFSRHDKPALEPVDVDELLGSVRAMLERVAGSTVSLAMQLDAPGARVRADRLLLEQIVVNLASNARDAMPDGGSLAIATARTSVDGDRATDLGVAAGDFVVLTVRDSGMGMDDATRARVFDAFFTTKPKDLGTGLGLSVAAGIVRDLGGAIAVESAPGVGATFRVYLPTSTAGERVLAR